MKDVHSLNFFVSIPVEISRLASLFIIIIILFPASSVTAYVSAKSTVWAMRASSAIIAARLAFKGQQLKMYECIKVLQTR